MNRTVLAPRVVRRGAHPQMLGAQEEHAEATSLSRHPLGATQNTRSRCGAPWVPPTISGNTHILARAHPPQGVSQNAEVHVREGRWSTTLSICAHVSPPPQTALHRSSLSTRSWGYYQLTLHSWITSSYVIRSPVISTHNRISTHATHARGQPLGADPTSSGGGGVTALASLACLSWSQEETKAPFAFI